MADAFSLGAIGAFALTEGIKFLYEQAKDVITRWREARAARDKGAEGGKVELPGGGGEAIKGRLEPAAVDLDVVEEHAEALTALRRALIEYADEGREVRPGDPGVVETVEALRGVLQLIYGQTITFAGEAGPPSGTRIDASVEAKSVSGYLAGVRARGLIGGDTEIRSRMSVDRVEAEGTAVAVDLDFDGRRKPSGD